MKAAEIRALLAEHQLARPDHLVCLHPQATPSLRRLFTDWLRKKEQLQTMLLVAEMNERDQWRDVSTGQAVPAPTWEASPTAEVAEARRQAGEIQADRAAKRARVHAQVRREIARAEA